jgi:hypothetical protein
VQPFFHEAKVEVGEDILHLVLNFRAIDVIESITGESMDEILPQMIAPKHGLGVKVLYGMLREHHEGITLDEVAAYFYCEHDTKIGLAMADVISRAYPRVFGKAKDKNPPKRRGASKTI